MGGACEGGQTVGWPCEGASEGLGDLQMMMMMMALGERQVR